LHLLDKLPMNPCLTGGSAVSSRRETVLSPWLSARYHKCTHKFGIEIPKTVEEAYALDKATGTTFWHDPIEKEMKNVHVAFDVRADGGAPPPDHQFICCHMSFDIKMEDF